MVHYSWLKPEPTPVLLPLLLVMRLPMLLCV
jgi:hypothetical protein